MDSVILITVCNESLVVTIIITLWLMKLTLKVIEGTPVVINANYCKYECLK